MKIREYWRYMKTINGSILVTKRTYAIQMNNQINHQEGWNKAIQWQSENRYHLIWNWKANLGDMINCHKRNLNLKDIWLRINRKYNHGHWNNCYSQLISGYLIILVEINVIEWLKINN
jgi:hypothetical protein